MQLEREEAATPGAAGLLDEAESVLRQLAAFKAVLRDVSQGVFSSLTSLAAP